MNIPNELVTEWFLAAQEQSTVTKSEYIAQRAAEWALSHPVSMEPVAWGIVASNTGRICQVELDADEVAEHNQKYIVPLYTATQLAAARQQGAEEEGQMWEADYQAKCNELELVHDAYGKRIADLEKSNAQLLEALKGWLNWSAEDGLDLLRAIEAQARAAIAEVKP